MVVALALTLFAFTAVMSGFNGNVTYAKITNTTSNGMSWDFDRDTGVLVVSGKGKMFDYQYFVEEDVTGAPWRKYVNEIKSVVIKEGITYVGAYSFTNCRNLTKVVLPKSLQEIGKAAFSSTGIYELTIPESVKIIGPNAFSNCYALDEVYIGSGLKSLGDFSFASKGLKKITYDGTVEQWDSIAKSESWISEDTEKKLTYNFLKRNYGKNNQTTQPQTVEEAPVPEKVSDDCGKNLKWKFSEKDGVLTVSGQGEMYNYSTDSAAPWEEKKGKIKKVVVEKGVTYVGDYAFSHCAGLESIELPDTLQKIGRVAFSSTNIRSITIPVSVTEIDVSAFANCLSLEELNFSSGIKRLNDYCFSGCNIKKINYGGSMEAWGNVKKSNSWNIGINEDRLIFNYMKNGVMTDYCHYDPNIINVFVDGKYINFDTKPQFVNGRTMVPLRRIFEELGAYVQWDNATWSAIARKDGIEIRFTIDDYTMYKNGSPNTLDVPAQLINGRTLVPLRAVSEALGCDVGWDGNDNVVSIISDRQNYTMLYTRDGRSRAYTKGDASQMYGWYNEPSVLLYNCEGSRYFLQSEASAQVKAGWSYTYVNGHNWKAATCTAPQTCTRCGKTSGSKREHSFNKKTGKCDYCSKKDDGGGISSF